MVSKQPRKQRAELYSLPMHRRHKLLAARLSDELREKYKTRSLPVRKGDRVRIIRGDFKKLEGEVLKVDTKRRQIQIQGVTVTKADGTQVTGSIRPSNVMLLKLAEDKARMRIIERRSKIG
jgi:large subunit ribosomal protein L24